MKYLITETKHFFSNLQKQNFEDANLTRDELARKNKRKADLSTIWSALISYNFMEWEYPETNTTNMVSVKKIEDKIKDHLWDKLPLDPKENNSFYYDWSNFVWEYWYKLMTKNGTKVDKNDKRF